ncbi:type VI secretion system baseplate subunit TssF [Pedobacter hartonius]|uniref:Type VI secretion system protein ImpG n=1 Tax=Pedobacter hartonius TaxID=425514 RepID=A0A1H4H7K9_9SPHI|nr:type VI secretion system baseplate subunit TssF [Pedobacter hartonius]SEB17774.1 hypothetical protein SAMN05443550_11417 [Pedobacter hartonius]
MKGIFYSSKDEIRNRMLKNARDFWDVKNTNDFDPMVKLLIEALCTELFNISNEVNDLENRILDKISKVLASDTLISAIPAHAILHARPYEDTDVIDEKDQFIFSKKISDGNNNKEVQLDLFFSPLRSVKVFNAAVSYIATGTFLFRIDEQQNKSLISQSTATYRLENNAFYIGLSMPSALSSYDGLSFYFDWPDYAIENNIYDLLKLSAWFMDGHPVKVSSGRYFQSSKKQRQSPFSNHDMLNVLTADIHGFYAHRFLTIDGSTVQHIPDLQLYPSDFEPVFRDSSLQNFKKPLLWIKVIFPVAIGQPLLNELSVSINAFPVVNKKMHDLKHRLKMMSDIIPLKLSADDQFLGVDTLKDNFGNHYTEIPQGYDEERSSGLFSIRYGGAERFDDRNAKEVLDHLFELLRDEKAAFSAYGSDFLNTSLKELEQNISLLVQKTAGQLLNRKELINYLVVKPLNDADIMFMEFWSTKAELGNQVKRGSSLRAFEHHKAFPESLYFLSNSIGGRSRLNAENRVQAYKYGLTTGNRIVTHADILGFCSFELGNMITGVEIRKGLSKAQNPKEGFIKTTDIVVTPAQFNGLNAEEWKSILELTRSKLEIRSTMNIHYRLFLA